jgi:D-glycero-D-manno-heptose 1,7-bisphosphate phosphatase
VAELGGRIELIEFCPELPDDASAMRKPGPGMLLDLGRRLQASLERVPFVGDTVADIQAARAAAMRPILVLTGKGQRTKMRREAEGVECYADLAAFAGEWIARAG